MVAMATDVSAASDSRQSTMQVEKVGGAWDVDNTAPAMLPVNVMSTSPPAIGLPPRMKTAAVSSALGPSMSKSSGRPEERGTASVAADSAY